MTAVTKKSLWLLGHGLNRGDHISRFDCTCFFQSCAEAEFKEKFNNLFSNVTGDVTDDSMRTLMFGDYLSNSEQERPYDEIQNLEQLKNVSELQDKGTL